jgi:hypothetical protein
MYIVLTVMSAIACFATVGYTPAQDTGAASTSGRDTGSTTDRGSATDRSSPLNLEEISTLDQIRQLGELEERLLAASDVEVLNNDRFAPKNVGEVLSLSVKVASSPDPRQQVLKKINELRSKLTLPEEDRQEVAKQLKTALIEYFIADMQHRVRELDEIKAKVAEMEAKLDKRLRSQQEAVDLQLSIFLREADGLGFFSDDAGDISSEGPKKTSKPANNLFWFRGSEDSAPSAQ